STLSRSATRASAPATRRQPEPRTSAATARCLQLQGSARAHAHATPRRPQARARADPTLAAFRRRGVYWSTPSDRRRSRRPSLRAATRRQRQRRTGSRRTYARGPRWSRQTRARLRSPRRHRLQAQHGRRFAIVASLSLELFAVRLGPLRHRRALSWLLT